MNGYPKNLVMGFADDGGGSFAARPDDIAALGIVLPGDMRKQKFVRLRDIGTYRYDESAQKIHIDIPPTLLIPSIVDARGDDIRQVPAQSGLGAVLNYALVGSAAQHQSMSSVSWSAAPIDTNLSLTLEGRVFSPSGLFEFGAITGTTLYDGQPAVRLDTNWQTIDEQSMTVVRFGDAISGSLAWTRPIRFGGLQYQRNFSLRSDLVTLPLPVVTGTAAVPSTVDIFVDNVRTYSREIAAGPFTISNVPVVGNGGEARVVVRDASGRITETTTSFYTAPVLLRQGLLDFSLEAGAPRRNFGALSFDYQPDVAASASARYGWSDRLTIEGHAEMGLGLVNAGVGAIFPVGATTLINVAMRGSHVDETSGGRLFSGIQTKFGDVIVTGSVEVSAGRYNDLATASTVSAGSGGWARVFGAATPRAQATMTVSSPIPMIEGHASLSLVEARTFDEEESRIVTARYGRRLADNMSGFLTTTLDVTDRAAVVFLGLNMALQDRQTASLSANHQARALGVTAEYAKFGTGDPGSFGWRATVTRGGEARSSAGLSYQAQAARIDAYAIASPTFTTASAYVTGAVATIDGEIYTAETLDDGFAVVDVGLPGVDVKLESRSVGRTNESGRVFVPRLRSHAPNQLSIDPLNLPPDVQPSEVNKRVAPMRRAGMVVDMKVKPAGSSALVEFVREDGPHIALGSAGVLARTGEEFLVGFDGQAFFETLSSENKVTIQLEDGSCQANFAFKPKPGEQVFLPRVVCK